MNRLPLHGQRALTFGVLGAAALVALAAASFVAKSDPVPPKPLIALLIAAGAAILVSIRPEHLFLGWLFVAPLIQESADQTSVGHVLALSLYLAPPVVLAGRMLLERQSRSRLRWYDILPATYALYVAASMALTTDLVTTDPVTSLKSLYLTVGLGALVYYLLVFGPIANLSAIRIVTALLAACALQGALALVDWTTGWNLWNQTEWSRGIHRAVSTLSNPGMLGAFLGVGVVTAIAVLGWRGPASLRRLSMVVLVLGIPGVLVTFTRGPVLATAVAGALCAVLGRGSRVAGLAVLVVAVLGVLIAWPRIESSDVYQQRVAERSNIQTRALLQEWSFRLAAEKPVTGWGYGSFDRAKTQLELFGGDVPVIYGFESTSHNTYLTVLVEFGGLGLLLLLLPGAVIVWRAFRRARAPSPDRWLFVAGIGSVFVILITASTLDFRFFSFVPMVPWIFLALMRRADDWEGRARSAS